MLEEKILHDYQQALKLRDTLKAGTLSFLRAELINVAMAKKKAKLEDSEVITVIRKQIKARQDSIAQFTQGNRLDLVEKEKKELAVLKLYLPPELSEEALKQIIEEAITATAAKDLKDMGRVMKEVQTKVSGQADPKLVSELVKARLCSLP